MVGQPEETGAEAGREVPHAGASDRARAIYAISAAADLLQSAERQNSESNFEESIALSRDSMRMASSAVLFLEGKMASDLESSCQYIKERYDDIVPIGEWRDVERMAKDNIPERLAGILGGNRRQLEESSRKALESAAKFFGATSAIVGEAAAEAEAEEPQGDEDDELGEAGGLSMPRDDEEGVYGEAS